MNSVVTLLIGHKCPESMTQSIQGNDGYSSSEDDDDSDDDGGGDGFDGE